MIGIAGIGYVGGALSEGLRQLGLAPILYDPLKLPQFRIEDLVDCDVVFVCVPTPQSRDGKVDSSFIRNVLTRLSAINYKGVVTIKSTIIPTEVTKFKDNFNLRLTTNPEFLTQRTAIEDFLNTKFVILGGESNDITLLENLYKRMFGHECEIVHMSAEGAMMVKYMTNVFFATKVTLMNEFYSIWEQIEAEDWENVINTFAKDSRVNPMHLMVPGPDDEFGYGGACFPKDISALNYMANKLCVPHAVMQSAINENEVHRSRSRMSPRGG